MNQPKPHRSPRLNITHSLSGLAMFTSCLVLACAGNDPALGDKPGALDETFGKGDDPGKTASTPSLDLSGWGLQSANWCELPNFTPGAYEQLDKAKFVQLFADYSVGWSSPGYEALLGLDEEALFNSSIELFLATFDRQCRRPYDADEFPSTDMLDLEVQQEGKDAIIDFFSLATEVETGDTLRLAVHDCTECDEPLGSQPRYINARLTSDGVLTMNIEFNERARGSHTIILSPNAVIIQASLDDVSAWFKDLNADTRSGETLLPEFTGTVTAVVIKDNQGAATATLGVAGLSFNSRPGDAKTVTGGATSSCIGAHAALSAPENAAGFSLVGGDLRVSVPGTVQCEYDDCGQAELDAMFDYQLGDVSITSAQPNAASDAELMLGIESKVASRASVGGEVYASGGPGPRGQGGRIGLTVDNQEMGYVVTFSPPLSFGGAMTLSRFSEQTRLLLPGWLQDEIFDISFGGDPAASIFVPHRGLCELDEYENPVISTDEGEYPDYHPAYEVERREVQVRSGSLSAVVGSGTKTATIGQCLALSSTAEDELTLTSDWLDVGFSCSQ